MRLRSEDTVLVIKGRDRGKQGRIQQVFPKKGRVLVDGVNIVSRHTRAASGVRQGGIIQKELPIQAANVMLVCTHCNRPTRIGARTLSDGTKARTCKRCQEVIE
jgi:large subunit ribosomal protein L24